MIASSSFILFLKFIWNMLCLCAPHFKIQPAITGREDSCFWLFSPWSRGGHGLRPIFFALVGQNLIGEFMREIYAASWNLFTLTAEADRVLCKLVMFLTVFSTGCTKWNSAAIKSLLLFMASLFIGFLFEKYVACQSRKSDFGWHRLWNTAFCPRSVWYKQRLIVLFHLRCHV